MSGTVCTGRQMNEDCTQFSQGNAAGFIVKEFCSALKLEFWKKKKEPMRKDTIEGDWLQIRLAWKRKGTVGLVFLQDHWRQIWVGGHKSVSISSYCVGSWQCITFLRGALGMALCTYFFMRHLESFYSLTGRGNPDICMALCTNYSIALLLLWSCPVSPYRMVSTSFICE